MRNTKNAFTLVELIVVITILAILGTIAFISLQGYSGDARNTKRTSDLNNMQGAITTKVVEGVPLASFVADNSAALTTLAIAGLANNAAATITLNTDGKYAAGIPAYAVLGIKPSEFKDPTDNDYRVAVTSLVGGKFEVAARIEGDNGNVAKVVGTYSNRIAADITITNLYNGAVINVPAPQANYFKVDDTVTLSGGANATPQVAKVLKVARDGITVTLDASIADTDRTTLILGGVVAGQDDNTGLIVSTAAGADTPVVNDLANVPY